MKIFHVFPKYSNKYQPYNKRLISSLKTSSKIEVEIVSLRGYRKDIKNITYVHKKGFLNKLVVFLCGVFFLIKIDIRAFLKKGGRKKIRLYGTYRVVLNNPNSIFHFHNIHSINKNLLELLIERNYKFIVSLRGNDVTILPLIDLEAKNYTIKVLRHAWKIHSVCESLKNDAIALSGVESNKIDVIYRTPNLKDLYPVKDLNNILMPINIFTVSRIHWKKCVSESFIAIKDLVGRGFDVHYHVLGDLSGTEKEKIIYLRKKLKLEDKITLHGFVKEHDYKSILKRMHICWIPTINEGIPNTLYFFLKSGFPIIASDTDGIPEVIKHKVNGLLFKPYDFLDLANITINLLNNPQQRVSIQKEARLTLLQTENNEIKEYESLYLS